MPNPNQKAGSQKRRSRDRASNSVFKYITGNVIFAISMGVILNMFFLGIVSIMVMFPSEPEYYITYSKQRDAFLTGNWRDTSVLKITELLEPNQSDTSVVQWANEAIIDLYTYDFLNYHTQVWDKRRFFTEEGWASFISAIRESKLLEEIRKQKLTVSAIVVKQALLQRKGVLNGKYSWSIKLPVLVNYQSASETVVRRYLATVIVQRRSPLFDPKGVGISSFSVSQKGSPS